MVRATYVQVLVTRKRETLRVQLTPSLPLVPRAVVTLRLDRDRVYLLPSAVSTGRILGRSVLKVAASVSPDLTSSFRHHLKQ